MKYKETAGRLSSALSHAGMTQQELSERSGVNKASISQYMNGTHIPSNISSGKMAKVLGVNPVWLMGFDVPMIVEAPSSSDQMLSEQAQRIAAYYMKLSPASQKAIKDLTDLLYEKEKDAD